MGTQSIFRKKNMMLNNVYLCARKVYNLNIGHSYEVLEYRRKESRRISVKHSSRVEISCQRRMLISLICKMLGFCYYIDINVWP